MGGKRTHLIEGAAPTGAEGPGTADPSRIRATHKTVPGTPAGASPPRILLAILAKQKEAVLPFYLKCIEAVDYPKTAISLYVRTNNNKDRTREILRDWVARAGPLYARVEMDDSDAAETVQRYGVHEWNSLRFRVLGRIRQNSLEKTLSWDCEYYFVVDVDNFIRPQTLKDLVALNAPIVAPFLRHVDLNNPYSNYHFKVDANGYYAECEEYYWLHQQRIRGVYEVGVAHCTYLVHRSVIPALRYDDGSGRHEYVVFSDSARKSAVPQYLDNRQIYGFLTLDESAERARELLEYEINAALKLRTS